MQFIVSSLAFTIVCTLALQSSAQFVRLRILKPKNRTKGENLSPSVVITKEIIKEEPFYGDSLDNETNRDATPPSESEEVKFDDNSNVTKLEPVAANESPSTHARPSLVVNGICMDEGVDVYESDCHFFYICLKLDNGSFDIFKMQCVPGKAWNRELKRCDHERNVEECRIATVAEETTSESFDENTQEDETTARPNHPKNRPKIGTKVFIAVVSVAILLVAILFALAYYCIALCRYRAEHILWTNSEVYATKWTPSGAQVTRH